MSLFLNLSVGLIIGIFIEYVIMSNNENLFVLVLLQCFIPLAIIFYVNAIYKILNRYMSITNYYNIIQLFNMSTCMKIQEKINNIQ